MTFFRYAYARQGRSLNSRYALISCVSQAFWQGTLRPDLIRSPKQVFARLWGILSYEVPSKFSLPVNQ